MKTCLTCGASVADDADVCPDCGMEFESAPTSSTPQATPAINSDGDSAGYTVDFGNEFGGDNAASLANADESNHEFSASEPTVVLDKSEPISTPAPVAATPTDTAHITLRRGGALTNETFRFASGAVVGRFDPDSGPVDVDLAPLPEASYVSRHHAEFRRDGGNDKWFVKDMGSSNGTFWRAGGAGAFSRLSGEQELSAGDEISLGNARFEFGVD